VKIFVVIVWLLVITEVGLPLFAWNFPTATGYIEGFTHKYLAWGRCRIDNTKAAIRGEGALIFLGYACEGKGELKPHMWAEVGGKVIDHTYPQESGRKVFAVVDAKSFKVVWNSACDEHEKELLKWAMEYLPAFARADGVSGA
jgi:hypothetical protein